MKSILACLFAPALAKFQNSLKLLLLACLACLPAHAQNKKAIDSLMRVYNTAKHDTNRIMTLTSIAHEFSRNKPDTCISISQKALEMSEKIGFEKGKGRATNRIGVGYQVKGKYAEALISYQKALPILEKIQDKQGVSLSLSGIGIMYYYQGDYPLALEYHQKSLKIQEEIKDKQGISKSLSNIGETYRIQAKYALALEYLQKSLKIGEEIGDKQGISASLSNIGIIYNNQGNYPLALEYHQKSLKIKEEIGDKQGIGNSLNNIAMIYSTQDNYDAALESYQKSLKIKEEIGDKGGISTSLNNIGTIYKKQGNYPLALEYHQKSLKIREEIGDKRAIGTSLNNIAYMYLAQNNYLEALEYLQRSLEIHEQIGDKRGLTNPLNGLAQVAQKQQEYDKSIAYAQRSLQIAQEIKAPSATSYSSKLLSDLYKLKGDYAKALEYYELYKTTNDSIFNTEKSKAIANLEAKAEIDLLNKNQEILKKDSELQRINIEKERNARLFIEKQAEADKLFALARQEKDKNKQDSLHALANMSQLQADNLLIKQRELTTKGKAREQEVIAKQKQIFIDRIILAFAFLSILALTWFGYAINRSRERHKRTKEMVKQQNEEISQVNEELNTTLTIVEQERAKSDQLLLSILPAEVAGELKETGKTEVKYFESVTVLFADVKGFSKLATKLTPQELIAELDETFTKMDEISERFGLERIKTIGDCYMACGGLPNANKTHPFDTVLTALNIQHWMNEEWERRQGNFWEVRLGLHTGDAVAGVIGKTKFAYDVWGNTVNIASRMESGGEVGKVNVTQETFEAVQDFFEGDYREEIEAKNIGKVHAYFITRLKPEYAQDELGFEPNEKFWEKYRSI